MSDLDITVVLDDLAAGRIDAAEAKRRIDGLGLGEHRPVATPVEEISTEWRAPRPAEPEEPEPDTSTAPPPSESAQRKAGRAGDRANGINRVVVRATGRRVRVLADATVATATAENVHQTKRSRDVLEIHGDKEFSGVVDAISWVRSIRHVDDLKELGLGQELTVRVNPALTVDLELVGSTAQVTDVPRLGKVRLTASQATVTGVSVVSDLLLQAGQVSVSGRFTSDWSRIRAESGQAVVVVDPASDVTIRADAQVGRISWEGTITSEVETTVGRGTAHLDLGVVLGHGVLRVGGAAE